MLQWKGHRNLCYKITYFIVHHYYSDCIQISSWWYKLFFKQSRRSLNHIYNNTVDIILCEDFNINYLNDNQDKQALNSLLASYRLYSIIDFPTRIYNTSKNIIDNIFINKFKNENHLVSPPPLDQRLTDHDAQVLSLLNIITPDVTN
jgi:hypothetical protein